MITAPTFATASTDTATSGHIGMKMATRSPGRMPRRRSAPASLHTSRSSSPYVRRRTSPGSPSQISAGLSWNSPSRWRSRQLCTMFMRPPIHHFAHGLPFERSTTES